MVRRLLNALRQTPESRKDAVLLFLVAGFLLWASATGRLRRHVATRYIWLTPVGAVFLIAMGLAGLISDEDEHEHCHGHEGHGRLSWLYRTCLILPFVLAAVVDPVKLSSEGLRKKRMSPRLLRANSFVSRDAALESAIDWVLGVATADVAPAHDRTVESAGVLPKAPTVRDIFDAAQRGLQSQLKGRFVTAIGQCEPLEGAEGNRFDLMRLIVVCCVADAQAVSVEVAPLPGVSVEPGTWVRVSGVIQFDSVQDPSLPVVHASMIEKIPAPDYPYL